MASSIQYELLCDGRVEILASIGWRAIEQGIFCCGGSILGADSGTWGQTARKFKHEEPRAGDKPSFPFLGPISGELLAIESRNRAVPYKQNPQLLQLSGPLLGCESSTTSLWMVGELSISLVSDRLSFPNSSRFLVRSRKKGTVSGDRLIQKTERSQGLWG